MKRVRSLFSSGGSSEGENTPEKKAAKKNPNTENLECLPLLPEQVVMADQLSPPHEPIPVWAQGLMADVKAINGKLDELNTTINGINRTVQTLTRSVQHASDTAEEAKKTADQAISKTQQVHREVQGVRQTQQSLEGKINSLNEYILKLECQSRRSNLKLDNVPERMNETPRDTEYIFRDVLYNMGMDPDHVDNIKIERCHRTGPRIADKPRTIIVKFNWYGDRDEIWANRKNLKGSDFWLKEDFPAVYEERRRKLFPYLQAARRDPKFKRVNIHIDKLSLNGRLYSVDQLDQLPDGLKPGQIATRSVNDITLFFRKESFLSNFHPANFKIENTVYNCSEQYYQARKAEFYNDDETLSKIMATDIPMVQYKLGKSVKGYKEHKERWYAGPALKAMEKGTCEKFNQNPHLLEALKDTGDKTLAEASPFDTFWGIGLGINHPHAGEKSRWSGENKLGNLLTALRDSL